MELGTYVGGLVTGLREGVEAALIVSIIMAYLARTGSASAFPRIWLGVGAAVVLSITGGVVLELTVGGLQAPYEQAFEGVTLLVAAAVVTWMLFWMRRTAGNARGELHARLDLVLAHGGAFGLTVLAFTAVIREGLETSLFLVGQITAAGQARADGAAGVLLGAVSGLAVAVAIGFGFYRGSRRVNLRTFFRWTGIVLVFLAAGLLGGAIHEFAEIGLVPVGAQAAFDISGALPHESGPGQFLAAILGYTSRPELLRLVIQVTYLVGVLALYLRPQAPPRPVPVSPGVTARS
jgi:high-affinity iron transporter